MNEKGKYSAVNLQIPIIWVFLVISVTLFVFLLWLIVHVNQVSLKILFSVLSLHFPTLLLYILTSSIIIDGGSIIKKSIFSQKSMRFSDIKSYGVYKQEGRFPRIIGKEEYDTNDWFGVKFIYISNRYNYEPGSLNQKGSIGFHYNKELFERIEEEIIACT